MKLANFPFMKNKMIPSGFQRTELTLCFQAIANGKREIDFLDFCLVMHKLYTDKVIKYVGAITF